MHLRLQRYQHGYTYHSLTPLGWSKLMGGFGRVILYTSGSSPSLDPFGELLKIIRTVCLNRMFTTQPDVSENVQKYLNVIDRWDWSPFQLNQLTGNRCLHFTMMKLWQRYNFSQRFSISPSVLMAYADVLEENYQIVRAQI